MVRFEKPPKAEVLPCIRFRETTDLDEVGDHASSNASSILPPPCDSWRKHTSKTTSHTSHKIGTCPLPLPSPLVNTGTDRIIVEQPSQNSQTGAGQIHALDLSATPPCRDTQARCRQNRRSALK
jgi:hypothetical protein